MSPKKLISVITVCLDAGSDLAATVSSVLGQSWRGFEYIIKDGLSDDGSIEQLPCDKRIRVIRKKDDGIFDAMNQALSFSNGKYTCFLNAGDVFYDTDVLKDVVAFIEANPLVDFFYTDIVKLHSRVKYLYSPDHLSPYFLYTQMLCHQAWFVSREVQLKNGGYEIDHKLGADYRMLLKLVLKEHAHYKRIPRFGVIYKGGGLSTDPVLLKESQVWRQEVRDEYFSKKERYCINLKYTVWKLTKMLLYDHLLYRPIRTWRAWRAKRKHLKSSLDAKNSE